METSKKETNLYSSNKRKEKKKTTVITDGAEKDVEERVTVNRGS